MKRIQAIVLSLFCLLLLPAAATAEPVTQEATGSQAPVIFYEHTIGRGLTFEPTVPSREVIVPELDNLISNVFIGREDIVITLFENADFSGKSVTVEGAGLHSVVDLGLNDAASSYEVAWKEGAAPVAFYEHVDATGWTFTPGFLASVPSVSDFPNDELSGVLINDPNTVVVLYEDIDFGGASLILDTVGLHDLEALGFNDIVSSFEIRAKE